VSHVEHRPSSGDFEIVTIAATGERFRDFAPYVASIDDEGVVAFQAALDGGESGVFVGDGRETVEVVGTAGGAIARICSHPDIDGAGAVSFYGELRAGGRAVFRAGGERGGVSAIAGSEGRFGDIGPLGPTMNRAGAVAFRAELRTGGAGIFVAKADGEIVAIATADAGGPFCGFRGLPVIDERGAVVFRADLPGGGQGVYSGDGFEVTAIVETGELLSDLGAFPSANGAGAVAFAGTLRGGGAGILKAENGHIERVAGSEDGFESFRGALIDGAGSVVFFATPPGKALGIYAGPDPARDAVLCVGDPLLGSTVTSFALNPVSINALGQLAIRVELASGAQAIVRAARPRA
jgi:hypothetical protein